jgi:carbon starvation protein
MILESFFAVLVLVAVGAMLPQAEYMQIVYPEGTASNPVLGFALGTGRLINVAMPFVPVAIATVFGILMIEGFVITTLDSAVRLCRYLLEEFWNFLYNGNAPARLLRPVVNTAIAVALMFVFSISSTVRQMWPVFGAGNQLIGALALITVSVWLAQRARQHRFALIPAAFMIVTTLAALGLIVRNNLLRDGNVVLGITASVLLCLAVGVVVVGVTRFSQAMQGYRFELPEPSHPAV